MTTVLSAGERRARSELGNASKAGDVAEADAARIRFATAKSERLARQAEAIQAYAEQLAAEAPPLSPQQRDHLALLLRGGAA